MTRTEIVEALARETGMRKKEVQLIVDGFLDKVRESIERDETVEIRGFGTFYRLVKKARKVHSPIAGKVLNVPSKVTMSFKASKIIEKVV